MERTMKERLIHAKNRALMAIGLEPDLDSSKPYLHHTVVMKRDGATTTIHLYGIKHDPAKFDPAVLKARFKGKAFKDLRLKDKDFVMHERNLANYLPKGKFILKDIDMADRREWARIESALGWIDEPIQDPIDAGLPDTKTEAFGQLPESERKTILLTKILRENTKLRGQLKKVKSSNTSEIFASRPETDMAPLDLRDAIMAAKIRSLVDGLFDLASPPKHVHVITGSRHTQAIEDLLKSPKRTKRIIDFWAKEAPRSVAEYKTHFKKDRETDAYEY